MACIRKWRGSWVVDWRDPTGKRFIESQENKEAAENRLAEVIKGGKQPASKRQNLKDYGDWWLENCAKGNIADSTYQEYEAVLKNHVYPLIGSRPFVKVDREAIRELIAAKKKEGYEQSTIRNILAPLRGAYNQAIEDCDAYGNPASRIGKFNKKKGGKSPINPLNREEVQIMLDKA